MRSSNVVYDRYWLIPDAETVTTVEGLLRDREYRLATTAIERRIYYQQGPLGKNWISKTKIYDGTGNSDVDAIRTDFRQGLYTPNVPCGTEINVCIDENLYNWVKARTTEPVYNQVNQVYLSAVYLGNTMELISMWQDNADCVYLLRKTFSNRDAMEAYKLFGIDLPEIENPAEYSLHAYSNKHHSTIVVPPKERLLNAIGPFGILVGDDASIAEPKPQLARWMGDIADILERTETWPLIRSSRVGSEMVRGLAMDPYGNTVALVPCLDDVSLDSYLVQPVTDGPELSIVSYREHHQSLESIQLPIMVIDPALRDS